MMCHILQYSEFGLITDLLGMNYCVNFFSPRNPEKWLNNPLSYFSVHTKADQIASVNDPISKE